MEDRKRPLLGVSVCLSNETGVLLVRRGKAPYRNLWSLPGGRVEFGEALADAARRELAEETGLDIRSLSFATLHEAIGDDAHAVIAVFTGSLPQGALPQAGDDAAAIALLTLAEITERETRGETTPGLTGVIARCGLTMPDENQ
ncbi:NUDIX hydrolase [Jiella mangrovi]|uniref:NUDIX hydrolase n=1 Tax=Jiella mangrovi TaxID=2821407 RepID=A0ABS4BDX9_9HYPH|nr:NUDIX hydrolase [Jiella mangrovi]MBP0614269.1 NUDIX hydrolase [Jiella mangrovi]